MRTDEITNYEDLIDSRDVIARIGELEEQEELAADDARRIAELHEEANATDDEDRAESLRGEAEVLEAGLLTLDASETAELAALRALADEAEGSPDWRHGETLIRDSYFEDYARQLSDDMHGRDSAGHSWPFTCIDWAEAASELQQDYFSVDFDGVTYWIRS